MGKKCFWLLEKEKQWTFMYRFLHKFMFHFSGKMPKSAIAKSACRSERNYQTFPEWLYHSILRSAKRVQSLPF